MSHTEIQLTIARLALEATRVRLEQGIATRGELAKALTRVARAERVLCVEKLETRAVGQCVSTIVCFGP